MIKILYKINEFRKNLLLAWAHHIFKKHCGLDILEVADILKEAAVTLDSLNKATQKFNKAVQRFRRSVQ
jgi:hypothetical protein